MKCFEYIRIQLDVNNLSSLNSLGSAGWHIVAIVSEKAVLERELTSDADINRTRDYWTDPDRK
jgi:hypothetical protein